MSNLLLQTAMRTIRDRTRRHDGCPSNGYARVVLVLGILISTSIEFIDPAPALPVDPVTATVVVLKNFPPQYVTTHGKPGGLAVDVIEEVARITGFNIHYMTVDSWDEGYEAIAGGRADIFPSVGITDKKRPFLDFTAPYDTMRMSLFVRAGTAPVNSLDDLGGRVLGVRRLNEATPHLNTGAAIVMAEFKTYDELFLALLSGTVDAVAAPRRTFLEIARGVKLDNHLKIADIPLWDVKLGVAVRKGNSLWLGRLDTAVKHIKASPRYSEILKKWEGEPTPFWSITRISIMMVVSLLLAFLAILLWRNRYVNLVNQKLLASKDALMDAGNHLQQLVDEKTEQSRILSKISSNVTLPEILSDICFMSERLHQGALCTIFLLDARDGCLRRGAAPSLPDFFIDAIDGVKTGPAVGSCGTAAFRDETVIVETISTHPYWADFRAVAAKAGLGACWAVPIHSSANEVLGVFAVYYKSSRLPDKEDMDFIKSQSSLASIAIERDQNMWAMRRHEKDLTKAKNDAVEAMVQANKALSDLDEQKFVLQAHSIVGATDPSGRITYVNDKFVELSQYSREELIGQDHKIVNSGYHPPEFFKDLWETISSGRVWSGEIKNKAKDGSYYWVATTIVPMINDDGEITKYVTAKSNITESKHTEEQLRRAVKMEAVGQLSGGISHDFNNILGIVQGNLELLQRMVAKDPKALGRVETALRGIRRGAELTKKLLGFSRRESRGSSLVSINALIGDMQDLITKSLTVSIKVENHLADDLWPVQIDSGDLEDSILNLALNAHDAMPDGGVLTIETANKVLDEAFVQRNPAGDTGEYVMLSVTDTGTGLSHDVEEKIFEPFFSTKEEGRGTGLGLSMVYGFVQRSSGFITIDSEPGKGTTFHIYLPRADDKADDVQAGAPICPDLLYGKETILVVDDEAALVDVAVFYLEDLGYKTVKANNGEEALKVLRERPDIDLLFSDVVMPGGMDGYELGKNALKDHPMLKVLLTSGFVKKREERRDDEAGIPDTPVSSLLRKPYSQVELATAVRRTLNENS